MIPRAPEGAEFISWILLSQAFPNTQGVQGKAVTIKGPYNINMYHA